MEDKITEAFDRVREARRSMIVCQNVMRQIEMERKMEHSEEWASAKNNDVRAVMLESWIAENPVGEAGEDYYDAFNDYRDASLEFKLWRLEIERLRFLIDNSRVAAMFINEGSR